MFNENIELEIKLRTLEECLIRKYENNEDPNTAKPVYYAVKETGYDDNDICLCVIYNFVLSDESEWCIKNIHNRCSSLD